MEANPNVREHRQYLTFQLAGEEYAFNIMQVREVIEYGTLTKIPRISPAIRGVINLRGNVVPVMDLALKFTAMPTSITSRSCIIIAEASPTSDGALFGIIADAVNKVVELSHDEILPPPVFGTGARVDFLRGIGKAGARFILLLDVDRVHANDDLEVGVALSVLPDRSPPLQCGRGSNDPENVSNGVGKETDLKEVSITRNEV